MLTINALIVKQKHDLSNEPVQLKQMGLDFYEGIVNGHQVVVKNEKKSLGWTPSTPVKVKCDCPNFQFQWAYSLYKQDALLDPQTFNLTPPKKTNPAIVAGSCKHVTRVLQEILKTVK